MSTALRNVFASMMLLWLASTAHAVPFGKGLLWEISRPGVAPSYLFGTMHIADPRLLKLPRAAAEAFARTRTFVLEMYPDEAVAQRFSEAGRLENGERLSDLLRLQPFELLATRLAGRGMTREQVERLKPWAALLLTTAAPGEGGGSLDIALYVRARYANLRIEELDTVEEQIAVFDDLPRDTQLALLQIALDRSEMLHDDLERSIQAYLRGDLAQLRALARRNGDGTAANRSHHALLEKKIIHDRSVVMAYRLQPHLRRGRVFAAVGALHLYGDKGMLQLLRDDGWRIRAVR